MKESIKAVAKKGRPPKDDNLNKSLSFKLSDTLLEAAQQKSKATGIALSFVLRKAVEEWLREGSA